MALQVRHVRAIVEQFNQLVVLIEQLYNAVQVGDEQQIVAGIEITGMANVGGIGLDELAIKREVLDAMALAICDHPFVRRKNVDVLTCRSCISKGEVCDAIYGFLDAFAVSVAHDRQG